MAAPLVKTRGAPGAKHVALGRTIDKVGVWRWLWGDKR
jgi:hypothetical protein